MFAFSSIEDYHSRLREGAITCVEAVQHFLDRIRDQATLNAFVRVYAEEALTRARELDEKRLAGKAMKPLHGVVVGIKDLICYKGHPVTASSKVLENFTSLYSATAVERLVENEAIIIGHQNCDEFGMGSTNEHSAYGKVLNPWDGTRVPGGSSGGSAAAQAAGLCMVSLGSDTGGSVRQPADFCGVIGLKPTYGRISRWGLVAYASSFDHIGILANNTGDVETVLDCISGPDEFDGTAMRNNPEKLPASDGRFRIAYFPEALDHPSVDGEIRDAIRETLGELESRGHEVKPVSFDLIDYVVPAYYILTTAEASSNLARYDGIRFGHREEEPAGNLRYYYRKTRSASFGEEVKRRILLGTFVLSAGYYDAYYTKAQKVRSLVNEKLKAVFNSHDVIILPNSPVPAFPAGEKMKDPVSMYLADIYTVIANLGGIPGISVPLFRSKRGIPFGLQAMSDAGNEVILLRLSEELMKMKEESR